MSTTQTISSLLSYRGMPIRLTENGMFTFTDGLTGIEYWDRSLLGLKRSIDEVLVSAPVPAPKPSLLSRLLDRIGF